jgi:hypothetical protein
MAQPTLNSANGLILCRAQASSLFITSSPLYLSLTHSGTPITPSSPASMVSSK